MIDRHDERVLLLLGLLMSQSQHGYQINEFIENNLGNVSLMKKATAYALLSRMEAEGLVKAEAEREGNRPTRRVYSITPEGVELMREMGESLLAQPVTILPPGEIPIMYISALEPEVAIRALETRLAGIEAQLRDLEGAPTHPNVFGVDLAIDRRIAILRADRDWFASVLERVRSGGIPLQGMPAKT